MFKGEKEFFEWLQKEGSQDHEIQHLTKSEIDDLYSYFLEPGLVDSFYG